MKKIKEESNDSAGQPPILVADVVNEPDLQMVAESFGREKRKVHKSLFFDMRAGLILLVIIYVAFLVAAVSLQNEASTIAVACFGIITLGAYGITKLVQKLIKSKNRESVTKTSIHFYGRLKHKMESKAQQRKKWIIAMNYLLITLFFIGGVLASNLDNPEGETYILAFTIIIAVTISAMIAFDLNRYYWKIGAEIFMLAETVIDLILISQRLSSKGYFQKPEGNDELPRERQTLDIMALVFSVLAICLLLVIMIHKVLKKKYKTLPNIGSWIRADMLFLIFVLSDNADFLLLCSKLLSVQSDGVCAKIGPKDILIGTLLVINPSISEVGERKAQQRISTLQINKTFLFQDKAKSKRNQKARESRKILVNQLKGGLQNKASAQLVWSGYLFFPLIMAIAFWEIDTASTISILFVPTFTGLLWYICVQRLMIFRDYFNKIFRSLIPSFFVGCWVLLLRMSEITSFEEKCRLDFVLTVYFLYVSVPMIFMIVMATTAQICREIPFRTIQSYDRYHFSEVGTPPVVDRIRELSEEMATDKLRKPISAVFWKNVRKRLLAFRRESKLSELLFIVSCRSRSVLSISFCMDTLMENYSIARKLSGEDRSLLTLDGLLLKIAANMMETSEHFLPNALRIVENIGNQGSQPDKTARTLMDILSNSNAQKATKSVNLELEGWPLAALDLPSFLMKLSDLKNHFLSLNLEDCSLGKDGKNLCSFLEDNETTVHINLNSNHMGDASFQSIAGALTKNNTLKRINLHGNEFTHDVSKHLEEILKTNCVLESFDLGNNRVEHEGAKCIATALEQNNTLKEISLCQNNIGDIGGEHIARALEFNKTLKTLNLEDNKIGQSSGTSIALALVLQKKHGLQYLDLSNNPIGKLTGKTFACTLQVNRALCELFLDNCGIGDESSRLIASSLQNNQTLLLLSLRKNDIGRSGGKAFANLVGMNSSIQDLDLGDNCIGEAASLFASKLSKNNQLNHLDLTFNNISLNVTETLIDAVERKTSVSLEVELSIQGRKEVFENTSLAEEMNLFLDEINALPVEDISKQLKIPKGIGFITLTFLRARARSNTADKLKIDIV